MVKKSVRDKAAAMCKKNGHKMLHWEGSLRTDGQWAGNSKCELCGAQVRFKDGAIWGSATDSPCRKAERLKSTLNTKTIGLLIEKAARKYFKKRKGVSAFYEHDQWWIFLTLDAEDRVYSVHDAEGGNSVNGFCFEEV